MDRLSKNNWTEYKQYPEKVLQFGEGNFLRGFIDWQIDKMNKDIEFNTGVAVVQPRAGGHAEKINEQDGLYTLYLQGIRDGKPVSEQTVINCITRGINPYKNYSDYFKLAESDDLRFIFSNTTEAGLAFVEGEKLDEMPQKSFPGKLTAFLYRRFNVFKGAKDKGLIIIPCELVERNGDKLKEIVLLHAERWNLGGAFIDWLCESNTFCCSLVDRIVPGYPKETIDAIQDELGYKDEFVVVGEQYHLMVIEGPAWLTREFPAHKANLNVKVVDDIRPFGTIKVRILNGAHTAMTPVAYLYGLDTVGEAINHEVVGEYIKQLIYEEIIPTLDLPDKELKSFAHDVIERFMNPYITHYLSSIALNSMSKFKTRDLPSLLEFSYRKGELPCKLVFSLSALISFYKGKRADMDYPLSDDPAILVLYKSLWENHDGTESGLRTIVTSVLEYDSLWERNLNELPGLTDAVTKYLTKIERFGIKEAIKEVLQKTAF